MIDSLIKLLQKYKALGDNTFAQLSDEELHLIPESGSNSIPTLVKHMHGNMLSRWTNFLTEDGEKDWRDREGEFASTIKSREEMLKKWEEGWECFLSALRSLQPSDFEKTIYIRSEAHTVTEAIHRQLAHYSYHIGQMVYLAKLIKGVDWKSLSIPPGKTADFNASMEEEAVRAGQFSQNS